MARSLSLSSSAITGARRKPGEGWVPRGRPAEAVRFGPLLEQLIAERPAANAAALLRLARTAGFTGSDRTFYRLKKSLDDEALPRPGEVLHAAGGSFDPDDVPFEESRRVVGTARRGVTEIRGHAYDVGPGRVGDFVDVELRVRTVRILLDGAWTEFPRLDDIGAPTAP